jgi:SH3-like domain-containing protein
MSRVRPLTRYLFFAIAALTVMVLIPADQSTTQLATMQSAALPGSVTAAPQPDTGDMQAAAIAPRVSSVTPATAAQPTVASRPPAAWGAALATVSPPAVGEVTDPDAKLVRVASAVNMRVGPSTATAKLSVLQPGEEVTITEMSGRWASIISSEGETGWVYARYLSNDRTASSAGDTQRAVASTGDGDERKAAPRSGRIGSPVVVRAGPSRAAPRLFVLEPGERVAVAETRGRWIRVVMESGASGWISAR